MTRRRMRATALVLCFTASACTDTVPTSEDGDLIPIETETFAVELPFADVIGDFEIYSGFGENSELPARYVAHEWNGDLEARTLLRFGALPATVTARPPDSGTSVPDSMFTPVSGSLLLVLDTADVRGPSSIVFQADATTSPWDRDSATWDLAVDTLGTTIEWPEPGGGPVRPVDEASWTPALTDSIRFEIDSLSVNEWTDPERNDRGLRISTDTEGARVRVVAASLEVRVRPSINPDTLVTVEPATAQSTFIYASDPEAPPGAIQIGGVPADRAGFELNLPEAVDPGPDACLRVECPVELRPERILYAGIGLYSHPPVSPGLAPQDSLPVEIRPALSPDRLPRSPLGCPIRGCGAPATMLAPGLFGESAGTPIEFSITAYTRALLEEPEEGEPPRSNTLVLLSGPAEPVTLEPAVFYGPDSEFQPYLRLILTLSDGLSLP